MKNWIRRSLKGLLNRFGYDVHRIVLRNPPQPARNRLIDQIIGRDIDLVFDVGANSGQFALQLRRQGYEQTIVSVEPLTDVYRSLESNAKGDDRWLTFNSALGAESGTSTINVSKNTWSSSMRPLDQRVVQIEPSVEYVGKQEVRVETLDGLYERFAKDAARPFLKLDVQGYENEILRNARESLARFTGVLCEASLTQHYEGEWLIHDLIGYLVQSGFALHDIEEVFRDRHSGQLIQVDALFWEKES
jgi:FkbM family methyltransferase